MINLGLRLLSKIILSVKEWERKDASVQDVAGAAVEVDNSDRSLLTSDLPMIAENELSKLNDKEITARSPPTNQTV